MKQIILKRIAQLEAKQENGTISFNEEAVLLRLIELFETKFLKTK